ncbi:hypothetical protein BDN67DRAFT_1015027 [Paxillus ammoniavirescens]|nr:hypothetical protein BDN67DRAFT_1015027 [Paxillus ammoniavirescens]
MSNTARISIDLGAEPLTTLPGHEGGIWGIAYLLGRERVVTCSDDGTVRIWDVLSGEQEGTSIDVTVFGLESLDVTNDRQRILSGDLDKRIEVWDVETHELIQVEERGSHKNATHVHESESSHRPPATSATAPVVKCVQRLWRRLLARHSAFPAQQAIEPQPIQDHRFWKTSSGHTSNTGPSNSHTGPSTSSNAARSSFVQSNAGLGDSGDDMPCGEQLRLHLADAVGASGSSLAEPTSNVRPVSSRDHIKAAPLTSYDDARRESLGGDNHLNGPVDYSVAAKREVEKEMDLLEVEVKESRKPQDLRAYTGTDYPILHTSLGNDSGTSPFNERHQLQRKVAKGGKMEGNDAEKEIRSQRRMN